MTADPDAHLDHLIDAVRTTDVSLDERARAAILARVTAQLAHDDAADAAGAATPGIIDDATEVDAATGRPPPRVVTPLISSAAPPRVWPRRLALGAAAIALAAAAAIVIAQLGPTEEPSNTAVRGSVVDDAAPRDLLLPAPPDDRAPSDQPGGMPLSSRPDVVALAPDAVNASPIVPPADLEAQRLTGERNIIPDDATMRAIARAGKTRLLVPLKVCLDRTGRVDKVKLLESSGFPAYDERLVAGVARWTYRPYLIGGQPVPVCSIVQFVYNQR